MQQSEGVDGHGAGHGPDPTDGEGCRHSEGRHHGEHLIKNRSAASARSKAQESEGQEGEDRQDDVEHNTAAIEPPVELHERARLRGS